MAKNIFEYETVYNQKGTVIKRRWAIGPILAWIIVTIIAIIAGQK